VTSPKPPDAAPLAERRPDPVTRVRPPPISPVSAQPTPRCPSPVADALAAFGPWLRQSWFYAVSALSLALAGIFLVQYGMENGLLPPRARVAAAPAFGAALIGIGEFIRRCFGDGQESVTAYLPSVFSGAGIVTLFGAILSARMLYDLIGGGPAMIGMVAIALLAMVLGWLHGPLLAAVGVIGAYGAPIFLSSSNTDGSPLFGYFAVVAVFGLGVDTIRRWGWVSALTLGLGYVTGWGLPASSGSRVDGAAILYFTVLPMLAIVIPAPNLMPDHGGCRIFSALIFALRGKAGARVWPAFPTLMAFGSVAASAFLIFSFWRAGEAEIWLSVAALVGLTLLLIFWSRKAPALQDLAALPGVALLASVFGQAEDRSATFRSFVATYNVSSEALFP